MSKQPAMPLASHFGFHHDVGTVDVECFLRHRVVHVPIEVFNAGKTISCGRPECTEEAMKAGIDATRAKPKMRTKTKVA